MKLYLFLGLTILIYCLGQILVDIKGKQFYSDTPKDKVYDIIWENFPDLYSYKEVVDILAILVSTYCFTSSLISLEEFVIIFGVIVIIRSISLQLMVLPKYPKCDRKTTPEIIIKGCYDKLFSGHFAYVYLLTLFSKMSPGLSLLINGANGLLITSSRRHYTIDIIMSFLLTRSVFYNKNIFLKMNL